MAEDEIDAAGHEPGELARVVQATQIGGADGGFVVRGGIFLSQAER